MLATASVSINPVARGQALRLSGPRQHLARYGCATHRRSRGVVLLNLRLIFFYLNFFFANNILHAMAVLHIVDFEVTSTFGSGLEIRIHIRMWRNDRFRIP